MSFFEKMTIYIGCDNTKVKKICTLLNEQNIKYYIQKIAHDEAMFSPGKGVGRSISGYNYSLDSNKMYEIKVKKKDFEIAEMLMKSGKN